jgi:hypothetical protein
VSFVTRGALHSSDAPSCRLCITDSIEITVSALSPGADVWVLLQRHITTFATASTSVNSVGNEREDEDASELSMALQLVESIGDVVRTRDVWARPSGAAVGIHNDR